MKIAVCVKQVPDSETRIRMDGPSADLDRSGFTMILNPYDAYAVEEAVKIKEAGEAEVTVITVGPDTVKETLKKDCLAVGCDKAVIINDPALTGADETTVVELRRVARSAMRSFHSTVDGSPTLPAISRFRSSRLGGRLGIVRETD